jgi:hypothetical protein
MSRPVSDVIVLYLNYLLYNDPLNYINANVLYNHVLEYYESQNLYAEFTTAISYLVDKQLIEERASHYRLTGYGIDHAYYLNNPPKDYPKISVDLQRVGNMLTVISIVVAILGTLGAVIYNQSRKDTSSPQEQRVNADTLSIPISLSSATDLSDSTLSTKTLDFWFAQTPSNPIENGVEFLLNSTTPVIETESRYSSNPSQIVIPINKDKVIRIHLLINLSYSSLTYTNGYQVSGVNVASIKAFYNGKSEIYTFDLFGGKNIREWVVGGKDVVKTVDSNVIPIWSSYYRDSSINAVVDHIVLVVPESLFNSTIDQIVIDDKSMELYGSKDPGIMVFGISVEYK